VDTAGAIKAQSPLKLVLKAHLFPDGCVIIRFKMLAYYRVRSAFEANKALPSKKIYTFKTSFGLNFFKENYPVSSLFTV
jgi:hypothetical protein